MFLINTVVEGNVGEKDLFLFNITNSVFPLKADPKCLLYF
jgi:hypothetical protein